MKHFFYLFRPCIFSILFLPLMGFTPSIDKIPVSKPDKYFTSDTIGASDNPYVNIENMPRFKKGNARNWVRKQTGYDESKGLYKKKYVRFYIESDGSVGFSKILQSTNAPLEKEALKVVQKMKGWKPARQNGKPIRMTYMLPVEFDKSRMPAQTVQSNDNRRIAPTKADQYQNYLKHLEEQEQIYNKQISLPEKYKMRTNAKEYTGLTDSTAYRIYFQKLKDEESQTLDKAKEILKNPIFTSEEKEAAIKIIETEYADDIQWAETHGPENFIQNYSNRTYWEAIQTNLRSRMELKKILSPEKHREFIMAKIPEMKLPIFLNGSPQAWIAKNIKYPTDAMRNNIQGKVYVEFIVEKDGSINRIKILRSSGNTSLDLAAYKVIESMPAWQPGTIDGKPVGMSYTLPVNFQLSGPPRSK